MPFSDKVMNALKRVGQVIHNPKTGNKITIPSALSMSDDPEMQKKGEEMANKVIAKAKELSKKSGLKQKLDKQRRKDDKGVQVKGFDKKTTHTLKHGQPKKEKEPQKPKADHEHEIERTMSPVNKKKYDAAVKQAEKALQRTPTRDAGEYKDAMDRYEYEVNKAREKYQDPLTPDQQAYQDYQQAKKKYDSQRRYDDRGDNLRKNPNKYKAEPKPGDFPGAQAHIDKAKGIEPTSQEPEKKKKKSSSKKSSSKKKQQQPGYPYHPDNPNRLMRAGKDLSRKEAKQYVKENKEEVLKYVIEKFMKEDDEWWTKMSADQQADYIRQHPQSQKAIDAKKEKEDDKSKSERPKTIHLDYDEAEDNINSLQYSGELSDYPGLTHNIGDMVNVLQSGHATDDDIQRAQDISNKIDDIDMTNPDAGLDDVGTALGMALKTASEKKSETGGDDKPKGKVSEKPGGASHIESTGGNNVLLAKGTREHIARHNKPGEGSVFSDKISIDDVQGAIGEIPEEFYEQGGGVHTTTVPNAGFNLVQKASDIEKNHPNAKKIKVKKQVGFDREKNEPIMKEVDAYIIDADKEEFSTDQLNVVVRPSNPDFMDDDLKNDSDVQQDLKGGKSHSVLTSFPGDPDVPPAQDWEESGHAIIIPNGGKDADKSNWVTESIKGRQLTHKEAKQYVKENKEEVLKYVIQKIIKEELDAS